jgi:DNA-binding beta-propeller fold protein YncE
MHTLNHPVSRVARWTRWAAALVAGIASLSPSYAGAAGAEGSVVVANRGSGTISIIDTSNVKSPVTLDLPAGDATPEPMYVVAVRAHQRVFVGDRANSRVVVYDLRDFSVETTIPVGSGVFHMWADPLGNQLWVNNDIDKTATVIDPGTLAVLTTVPMPADLSAGMGKPHDVILDPTGAFAFITMIGVTGPNDFVVKFDTRTFAEVDRAAVGKDPHLSLTPVNSVLYVPAQNGSTVHVLDRDTLDQVTQLAVPGAHGAGMMFSGAFFYTTNITTAGPAGIYRIRTDTNTIDGDPVDSPFPTPHNIVLTPDGAMLFLTHSGPRNVHTSVYAVAPDGELALSTSIPVGVNPFGIAFVPEATDIDGNGSTDGADLGLLLAAWETADAAADINGDGIVNADDLGLLLAGWSS